MRPVGIAEIAQKCAMQPDTVKKWTERYDNFPASRGPVGGTRSWDLDEVLVWLTTTGRTAIEAEHERQRIMAERYRVMQELSIEYDTYGGVECGDVTWDGRERGTIVKINMPGSGWGWEARKPHEMGIVNDYGFGFWRDPKKAAVSLICGPEPQD